MKSQGKPLPALSKKQRCPLAGDASNGADVTGQQAPPTPRRVRKAGGDCEQSVTISTSINHYFYDQSSPSSSPTTPSATQTREPMSSSPFFFKNTPNANDNPPLAAFLSAKSSELKPV